jgi:hypothetical protein
MAFEVKSQTTSKVGATRRKKTSDQGELRWKRTNNEADVTGRNG